jgi:subtilisin family serine protease/bacillopeptidase F (M6 metalloprotease family)
MFRRIILAFGLFVTALALLAWPSLAQTDQLSTGKISEDVRAMVARAARGEHVTVIVKMTASIDIQAVEGEPVRARSALRETAAVSQGALLAELQRKATAGKVGLVRQFWLDNLLLVQATPDVIQELARRKDVAKIFENHTYSIPEEPEQMRSQNVAGNRVWDSLTHVGIKRVWSEYGLKGEGIRIGGLDSGVDISHPDLAGKMLTVDPADSTYPGGWAEFDVYGRMVPGSVPHDGAEHGTHTSGTMVGGNASGYEIGVAPAARLMHGLVLGPNGGSFAQIVAGMQWIIDPDGNPATDDGAQVVNMSLGAGGVWDPMIAPIDNMVAAGVFPAVSIGNAGPDPGSTGSPGNVPSAFAVGATDSDDVIADFSSRGPVTWSTPPYVGTYIKPDISAPGVQILSCVPGEGWGIWDGTSMAAPHVAAAVALMLQANPSLTVATLKQLLINTAIDRGAPGKDNSYGYGRMDAYAAVSAALKGVGSVSGTVINDFGEVVAAARVKDVTTGLTITTDDRGRYDMQLTPGPHEIQFEEYAHSSQTLSTVINPNEAITLDVVLTRLPGGDVAGVVRDADTHEPRRAAVQVLLDGRIVKEVVSDPVTGVYSFRLPAGLQTIRVVAGYPYQIRTDVVDVIVDGVVTVDILVVPADVLVVADDQGDDFARYYEAALEANGRRFVTVSRAISPDDMLKFDSVVWLTGNDWLQTLTSLEQAVLTEYLDSGGRLFLSGQDIEFGTYSTPFYRDYLHAEFVADDSRLRGILGDVASDIGSGLEFLIRGGDGANNQGFPAEINPIAPAVPVFWYDEQVPAPNAPVSMEPGRANALGEMPLAPPGGPAPVRGTAGISVDTGVYRAVYLSFGFEGIADAASRTQVMGRVLGWLEGYPVIDHQPLGDTEDTDAPYAVRAQVTSGSLSIPADGVTLTFDAGAGPVTVPMHPTGEPGRFEASIPAQPRETRVAYYITGRDEAGHTSTNPVGAPLLQNRFIVSQDREAPTITHEPLLDTNDRTGPCNVTAVVEDNLGVDQVFLVYQKNEGGLHRVRMRLDAGEWFAAIPGPFAYGDTVRYSILAADASMLGNATRYPATGELSFRVVDSFAWDFESGNGGFRTAGVVWQWGAPASGPAGAHSGERVWGTVLNGDYPDGMNTTLDLPEITLDADKKYAVLTFWNWYEYETLIDGGNVKLSTDGGATWELVTPLKGYDGIAAEGARGVAGQPVFTGYEDGYWHQEIFDLSAYAGETVLVRLHSGGNEYVRRSGWYVDDVNVRSMDVDDIAPEILAVSGPLNTFDTGGPYPVSATVIDALSGVATVSIHYSTDNGTTWNDVATTAAGGDEFRGEIPGLPRGTRVVVYVSARDADGNVTASNVAGEYQRFNVMPSAPVLVLLSDTEGATEAQFRAGLDEAGRPADYWNLLLQGAGALSWLDSYGQVIVDERGAMTPDEVDAYRRFLDTATQARPHGLFVLGRDVALSASSRPFVSQYLRADFVQDDPGYRGLTGTEADPIGAGESLVIAGAFPDEVERSSLYPGGEIVYRFTGNAAVTEVAPVDRPSPDGVTLARAGEPGIPESPDAAAGIRAETGAYRSVFLTFNYDYVVDPAQRNALIGRVLNWLEAPRIVHTPLRDTEDTRSGYAVMARVFSNTLDPAGVQLTYDTGGGAVVLPMTPGTGANEFVAAIPPQPLGTRVNYFISARNSDGNTSHEPARAPVEQHAFRVQVDAEAPVIVHVPLESTADVSGPYRVSATVTDNTAVDTAGVALAYRRNGGSEFLVRMRNAGGDIYEGDIPGPSAVGDRIDYVITARDNAATPNTARSPLAGTHSFEIMDFFAWDFEADNGGYRATGTGWEHGVPATGPGGAHSGRNVWATALASNYPPAANITLDTPSLRVPDGALYARLSYWQWYYIEPNYDGGNVKISVDGGSTWNILTPEGGYPGTARAGNKGIPNEPCYTGYDAAEWRKVVFDLTPYRGQTVIVRWHFGSDPSVQKAGWYIDDVRVEGTNDIQPPVVVGVVAPGSVMEDAGGYVVEATIADVHSGVASADLLYLNGEQTGWERVAMTSRGDGHFSGRVPYRLRGSRIRFAVEARDRASNATRADQAFAGVFTVVPRGEYLLLVGGDAAMSDDAYFDVFAMTKREVDIWHVSQSGWPSSALLSSYHAVIVDWYGEETAGLASLAGDAACVVAFGYREGATDAQPGALAAVRSTYEEAGKVFDSRDVRLTPGEEIEFLARSTDGGAYALYSVNLVNAPDMQSRARLLDAALEYVERQRESEVEARALPRVLDMSPNYPNPFNPVTTLGISVPAGAPVQVTLNVYDVAGRLVRRVFSGGLEPGVHALEWNGRNDAGSPVASGFYFARFVSGTTVINRKMLLLK